MSRILQVFCILFSASLLSLGLPNELLAFGSPVYGFLSLIPFYFAYSNIKSYKEGGLLFALHAFIVHLISSFWLAFFKDFAVFTLGASGFWSAALGFSAGLIFYLPYSRKQKDPLYMNCSESFCEFRIIFKIIWFPVVYTFYEYLKNSGFIGYPWGTIHSTMYRFKIIIQIADITGTYGITFLTALFAAVIAEGFVLYTKLPLMQRKLNIAIQYVRISIATVCLLLCAFLYGTWKYLQPVKPVKYINAIMVQQNMDPWKTKTDNDTILKSQQLTKEKLEEARSKNIPIDLVIWSEGCLKYPYPLAENHYTRFPPEKPVTNFISECNLPFILGGPYIKEDDFGKRLFNSTLLFDNNGSFRGFYGKNHLVPMAESIPFAKIPSVADFLKKVIHISAGFTPGEQYSLFEVKGRYPEKRYLPESNVITLRDSEAVQKSKENEPPYVKISTPICFDDAFPDICGPLRKNGSEVFINLTDDSWSKTKSSELQHFVNSAYRTIEYRSSMARSTNSGYSVIMDIKGNILQDQPLFEDSSIIAKIPVYPYVSTIYLRLGNWIPKLIVIFIHLFMFITWLLFKKDHIVCSEWAKLDRISRKYKKKLEKQSIPEKFYFQNIHFSS